MIWLLVAAGLVLAGLNPLSAAAADPVRVLPVPGPVLRGFLVGEHDWSPGHRGVDLSGPTAGPVVAAAAGTVGWVGTIAGVPMLSIQHPDGLRTTYQPVVALVAAGDQVAAGQEIASLAAGHCPSGACLHWGLRDGETYLDPLAWLGGGSDAAVRLLPRSATPRQLPPAGLLAGGEVQPADLGGLPTAGPITSGFGSRINPISGVSEFHDGVDIGAPCGAPVHSLRAGVVTFVGPAGGYGLRVEIDHGAGLGSSYSHLSAASLTRGQSVAAGSFIAAVGTTGFSTGCHLHYSLTAAGLSIDPLANL